MRVTGGRLRGRTIGVPNGDSVRPTPSKVRQAMFDIIGQRLVGARVLDLYCGVGTLSIEALSRGAMNAVLIDESKRSLRYCAQNLETVGLKAETRMFRRRLPDCLDEGLGGPFDLIFSDPPYELEADDIVPRMAKRLARYKLLAPDGLWIHEAAGHTKTNLTEELTLDNGWVQRDARRYGQTVLRFLSRNVE